MPGVKEKTPLQLLAQARRVTDALVSPEREDYSWYERLRRMCDNLEQLRQQRPADAAERKVLREDMKKRLGHLAEQTARAIDYIEMRDGSYSFHYARVMGIPYEELKQKQTDSRMYTDEFQQRHKDELAARYATRRKQLGR